MTIKLIFFYYMMLFLLFVIDAETDLQLIKNKNKSPLHNKGGLIRLAVFALQALILWLTKWPFNLILTTIHSASVFWLVFDMYQNHRRGYYLWRVGRTSAIDRFFYGTSPIYQKYPGVKKWMVSNGEALMITVKVFYLLMSAFFLYN